MATPFWIKLIPVKSFRKKLKQKQREKEFRERFRAKVAFSCDIGDFDALQANGCIFPHPVGKGRKRLCLLSKCYRRHAKISLRRQN